jgi:hypothetical protein
VAACRYYGDEALKARISQAVRGLLATQEDNGYIGTYADSACYGPGTWNIWCRKYTLWALKMLNAGRFSPKVWRIVMADFLAARGGLGYPTLEIGINMRGIFDPEEFERQAGALIEKIVGSNPERTANCLAFTSAWANGAFLDSAARVPLILCDPDLPQGKVCDRPVSLVDIMPTLLQAVG